MRVPVSASRIAGTCASILTTSPVTRLAPRLLPLGPPVETMLILSTLASGSAMARTISGRLEITLSSTAAWLYS